jgi:hypothetical protein
VGDVEGERRVRPEERRGRRTKLGRQNVKIQQNNTWEWWVYLGMGTRRTI